MPSDKPPPKPAPKADIEKKVVWIACRATQGCKGNQAEMLNITAGGLNVGRSQIAGGGSQVRYKCLTCGKPFVIST